MSTEPAWEPPLAGTDTEHVFATLERLRATFRWKADGLGVDQLRARAVPTSAQTVGGLLKHLAVCEDDIFCWRVSGRPPVTWSSRGRGLASGATSTTSSTGHEQFPSS